MFECLWFFIYGTLSVTGTHHGIEIPIPEEFKFDNIALEIALDGNNKADSPEIESPDNVSINNDDIRRYFKDGKLDTFTDFIQVVIEILNKYNDADIEYFFTIVNDEVSNYHYNGCKFFELTNNYGFRQYIRIKLEEFKNKPATTIRQKILKIANQIEAVKYNRHEEELIEFINSLYSHSSIEKFNKFLIQINDYRLKRKQNVNLIKIVRDGLRSLIFNHYTKLDYNTRALLKSKLDQYWEYIQPIPWSHRAQLNAKEAQLLGNVDNDVGKFYFTKKQLHSRSPIPDKYSKEELPSEANMKKITFMTLYPKLVLDWHILSTTESSKYTLYRSLSSRYNQVKQNKKYGTDFITAAMLRNNRHATKMILRQMSPEDQHKTQNTYLTTEYLNKDADATVTTHTSMNLDDMPALTMEQFQQSEKARKPKRYIRPKHKFEEGTTPSLVTLYTIGIPEPIRAAKKRFTHSAPDKLKQITTTKHKAFIEVVTLRPFVPKKIIDSKKIKYDINLKSTTAQPNFRMHVKSSNEDSGTIEGGLALEESKNDGTKGYRRNYNRNLPANSILIDRDVLTRLQELENELNNVRSLANNDTVMIKDLKKTIHLDEKDTKTSKEYIVAKVIPCNTANREISYSPLETFNNKELNPNKKQHNNNNIGLNHEINMQHFDVTNEDIRIQHSYEKHERQNIYPSNSENEVRSNAHTLTYINSRKDMIRKMDEIKNKFYWAIKENEKSRRNAPLTEFLDFEKEYIPNKESFYKNMRKLKKYLASKNKRRI